MKRQRTAAEVARYLRTVKIGTLIDAFDRVSVDGFRIYFEPIRRPGEAASAFAERSIAAAAPALQKITRRNAP